MKKWLVAGLLFCLQWAAGAQEPKSIAGIPADVYYLMPSFGNGYIYFRGQMPAQGQLNICAVDNTIHYMDKGEELVSAPTENIIKVRIDTVSFLHSQGVFYRLYPVTAEKGVALRRKVNLKMDEKEGAFGTTSRTSSTKEYGVIYADGVSYILDSDKTYPYEVSETLFLYYGDKVLALNKKNLKKLFPEVQFETLPKTLEDALALLR